MKSYNWITQTRLEGGWRRQILQRIFGKQNSTELWKFYPFERWILDYPHYNEVPNLGPVNKLWFFGPLLKIPTLRDLHSRVNEDTPAIKEVYKGSFNNHVDIISHIFNHLPTSVDIFYVLNVDKNGKS